jgi:hypothetical protein
LAVTRPRIFLPNAQATNLAGQRAKRIPTATHPRPVIWVALVVKPRGPLASTYHDGETRCEVDEEGGIKLVFSVSLPRSHVGIRCSMGCAENPKQQKHLPPHLSCLPLLDGGNNHPPLFRVPSNSRLVNRTMLLRRDQAVTRVSSCKEMSDAPNMAPGV